jgi:hypothetical protein
MSIERSDGLSSFENHGRNTYAAFGGTGDLDDVFL